MWRSATSSERRFLRVRVAAAVLIAAVAAGAAARARVLLTAEEALRLAFPGCETKRQVRYLTEEQVRRAAERSGVSVPSALVTRFVASCEGRFAATAYLDTHRVRTLPETLLVVVRPDGTVGRVEVLSFREPPDYLPRKGWYEQFAGHGLDDELRVNRAIPRVTGATLTSRATTEAVRRVLAVHAVLEEKEEAP